MICTAVIAGAFSGIGRATAEALSAHANRVSGPIRHPASIAEADRVRGVEYRQLDLTDPVSIARFAAALDVFDLLVNNAGRRSDRSPRRTAHRRGRAAVPAQCARADRACPGCAPGHACTPSRRVIMVGSMLGSFSMPYPSSFVASKAALCEFATAASVEETPFGAWLTSVQPGQINTGLSERSTRYLYAGSPHTGDFTRFMNILDAQAQGIPPHRVDDTFAKAAMADQPESLYAVGSKAPLLFLLRRLLPRVRTEKLIASAYRLDNR